MHSAARNGPIKINTAAPVKRIQSMNCTGTMATLSELSKPKDKGLIWAVEGNIGAGKSTLLSYLKEVYKHMMKDIDIVPEPIEKWTSFFGHNLLAHSYRGNISHAVFQLHILFGLATLHQNRPPSTIHILERSLESGRYVFLELQRELHQITEIEYLIIKNIYKEIRLGPLGERTKPTKFFYLRIPAEIAFQRMRARGRLAESKVDLAYLKKVEAKYDAWLLDRKYPESQPEVEVFNPYAKLEIWMTNLREPPASSHDADEPPKNEE